MRGAVRVKPGRHAGFNLAIGLAGVLAFSLLAVAFYGTIAQAVAVRTRYYSAFGALVCGVIMFGLALRRVRPKLQTEVVAGQQALVGLRLLFAAAVACTIILAVLLFGGLSASAMARALPISLWCFLVVNLGVTVVAIGFWRRLLASGRRWTFKQAAVHLLALTSLVMSWLALAYVISLSPTLRYTFVLPHSISSGSIPIGAGWI